MAGVASLGQQGRDPDEIMAELAAKRDNDIRWEDGRAFGGGIYATPGRGASVLIERSTVSENFAEGREAGFGGGIYLAPGTPLSSGRPETIRIINSTISENLADGGLQGFGGGIETELGRVVTEHDRDQSNQTQHQPGTGEKPGVEP